MMCGAAVAISVAMAGFVPPDDGRSRMSFVDVGRGPLAHLRAVHARLDTDIEFAYAHDRRVPCNHALLSELPAGSMMINATGMGKDLPGSPLTDAARCPERELVWELS